MRLFCLPLFAVLSCAALPLAAQRTQPPADSTIRQIVRTRDGSTLIGRVVAEDSASIRVETSGGVMSVPRANLLSVTTIRAGDMHGGEYWFPDPNRTRLFFAPTARMLDEGEGYYMNTYLLLQNFVGGLTDRVTVGGGFSLIPGVNPTNWLYYVTPKISVYDSDELHAAAGVLAGVVPHVSGGGFGLLYGVVTTGGRDRSISAGTGVGYAGSSISTRPVFMLGGETRVSRRVALLSENYLYVQGDKSSQCGVSSCRTVTNNDASGVISYGVRFLGEKLSVDFALFQVASHDTDWIFPGIPYVSFGVKF